MGRPRLSCVSDAGPVRGDLGHAAVALMMRLCVTPRQSNTIGLSKSAHIIGRNTPDGRVGSLQRAQILPVEEAGVLRPRLGPAGTNQGLKNSTCGADY